MTTVEMFKAFLNNIKVINSTQISNRYAEITAALNKQFRDTGSKTTNSLQVGSYGRYTGIKGISDLDMLYILPDTSWKKHSNKQSKLLTDVKDAIKGRYPITKVNLDKLVVTVSYTAFHIEVQPVFEIRDDESYYYKYPDTYDGVSWKFTKPRQYSCELD